MTVVEIDGKTYEVKQSLKIGTDEVSKTIANLHTDKKEYVLRATKEGKLILN